MATCFEIDEKEMTPSSSDRSASLQRAAFSASPRGILLLDGHTHEILDANPAAAALLGTSPAHLLRKTIFDLPLFRQLPDLNQILQQLGASDSAQYDDICINTQSAQSAVLNLSFNSYLVGTKKITECNLHLVTSRVRKQLRQRRQQTMAALAHMAEKVAGELNGLLPVITASSDLAMGTGAFVPPSYRAVEEVQKARERLAALARGLLAFSGKQALRFQPVDLNRLIASMDVELGGLLGEGVSLVQQLSPELPDVQADPAQLQQTIRFLAGFAGKRMPSGGSLKISTAAVEAEDPVLRDLEAKPGRYVRLMVSDTGVPLDDSAWRHLFEPFHGAAGDENGLGLASVYGIVKQSGGYLAASSKDAGLVLEIYLPDARSFVPVVRQPAMPATVADSETVVLFEAEDGMRNLVRNVLSRKGYRVLEARTEHEVRRVFENYGNSVNLLVANLTAAPMARSMAAYYPELRLIFISEPSENGSSANAMPADPAILEKPFRLDSLLARVRAVLDGGSSR